MTPKQRRILQAIRDLTEDGVSPSYRMIAAHLGLRSLSSLHNSVRILIENGHVVTMEGRYRSLRAVGEYSQEALARMSMADLLALKSAVDRRLGI